MDPSNVGVFCAHFDFVLACTFIIIAYWVYWLSICMKQIIVNGVDGLETRWKFNTTHYLC